MSVARALAWLAVPAAAVGLVGCGSSSPSPDPAGRAGGGSTATASLRPRHRPQVVEPVAGVPDPSAGAGASGPSAADTGAGPPGSDPAPTGPASAGASGPAPGAPSDAEIRREVARFQAVVRRYRLDRLDFSHDLIAPASLPPGVFHTAIASVFYDYGLPIACGGVLTRVRLGVANKELPCGTLVTFVYGGRAIRVPVIDRGPYIAGREWDLTGAAAEALRFPGLGPIRWRLGR